MNFSSNRLQRLSGLLTESVEDNKNEAGCSEDEVVEAMAAEMEKENEELKEFDLGDALKTGSVAMKVAKAVLDVIKKDPTLQKDISEVLPTNLVPHFQVLVSSEAKGAAPAAVDVKESKLRELIRGEVESAWASGEVFGRKAPRPRGVTMGFAGFGFKK